MSPQRRDYDLPSHLVWRRNVRPSAASPLRVEASEDGRTAVSFEVEAAPSASCMYEFMDGGSDGRRDRDRLADPQGYRGERRDPEGILA